MKHIFFLPYHKILFSYSSNANFILVLLHTFYFLLLCYVWKLSSGGKGQGREGKLPLFGYTQNNGTIILFFELKQREWPSSPRKSFMLGLVGSLFSSLPCPFFTLSKRKLFFMYCHLQSSLVWLIINIVCINYRSRKACLPCLFRNRFAKQ